MAVLADAGEEEVDAAGILDALLVRGAFADEVRDAAVEQVDLLRRDVDVGEELGEPGPGSEHDGSEYIQIVPGSMNQDGHKGMVTLWVLPRQPDILVHIERDDIPKRELASLHHGDKRLVGGERARAGGETEDELARGRGAELFDAACDVRSDILADGRRIVTDNEAYTTGLSEARRGAEASTYALRMAAGERAGGCWLL